MAGLLQTPESFKLLGKNQVTSKGAAQISIDATSMLKGFAALAKLNPIVDLEAKKKVALQLISNTVQGSSKSSVVPPLLTGDLRGSGSVFVEGKVIGFSPKKGKIVPNKSISRWKKDEITIGFQAPHAHRMHENLPPAGDYELGEKSITSGNVEGHFLIEHLVKDGKDLLELYGILLKKGLGM